MKFKSLIISLFYFLPCASFAQNYAMLQVSPKSPNAASFDKMIETPVSLSTGKIDVNLPLLEINIGQIKIPIKLNYNNNGLRPSEIPSWVGLGWSLSTGGHISYHQKGLSDFNPDNGILYRGIQGVLDRYFSDQMNSTEKSFFLEDVFSGRTDAEYDEYYYSIPNESGSFHFLSPTQANLNPKKDILVVKTAKGFKLTDDKGNIFLFESQEIIMSDDPTSISTNFSGSSTFYLTKITASNGEVADFTYKQYYLKYVTDTRSITTASENTSECPGNTATINVHETLVRVNYLLPESIKYPNGTVKFNHSTALREDLKTLASVDTNVPSLASIELYDLSDILVKKIDFYTSYFGNNQYLRLDKVQEGSDEKNSKKWNFNYYGNYAPGLFSKSIDHWGYANSNQAYGWNLPKTNYNLIPNINNYPAEYFADRSSSFTTSLTGMLKKITYPTGGSTEFEYESNKISTKTEQEYFSMHPLLTTVSAAQIDDYMFQHTFQQEQSIQGSFYVPKRSYYKISSYFQKSPDPFYQDATVLFTSGPSANLLNDKITSKCGPTDCTAYMEVVILEPGTYTYVVKGSSYANPSFPHETRYLVAALGMYKRSQDITTLEIGGNRIARVIHKEPIQNSTLTRKYLYNDTLSKIKFNQTPYYVNQIQRSYNASENSMICLPCGINYVLNEKPINALVGNIIEYAHVTTLIDDNGAMGKTEQEFILSDDFGGTNSLPVVAATNTSWRQGQILEEKKYSGSNSILQSFTKNFYVMDQIGPLINGLKVAPVGPCNPTQINNYVGVLSTSFSENFRLSYTEEILYDAGTIAKRTNYAYDISKHNYPVSISGNNSSNKKNIHTIKYTRDYANFQLAQTAAAKGLRKLDSSYINVPIEELEMIEMNGLKYIISGTLREYKPTRTVPERIYTLNITSPIPASTFLNSHINNSGEFIKDPNYTLRTEFSLYDNKHNILEQSFSGGPTTSYVWSYNGQYPIAEIKNAKYSAVESALGGAAAISSFSNIINPSLSIGNFLAPLRSLQTFKDADVTSYTYKPLIGLASVSDANGKTSYYEYDVLQRLKHIIDNRKNIIKSYSYSFKNKDETDPAPVFQSAAISRPFARNNCPTGQTGSVVYYTLEKGAFTSSTQLDADNKALADVNSKGQANANINGTCIIVCSGNDKKMIDGNCETGIRVNINSEFISPGSYRCTYRYEWSDGTSSKNYFETNSADCPIL